jgi:hypothetical protein
MLKCAAGCTGSTPAASAGSGTGPVPGTGGGSPRRSGRPSSRWPGLRRRDGWSATEPGSCPLTMSAGRRSGRWTPSPRPPGMPASPWGAARYGGSCWRRRCAGGAQLHDAGPFSADSGAVLAAQVRVRRPAAGFHGDLRRRAGAGDPAGIPARAGLVIRRAPDQGAAGVLPRAGEDLGLRRAARSRRARAGPWIWGRPQPKPCSRRRRFVYCR